MSADSMAFFNHISSDYDDIIERSVPRYREMFWAMLYYLPSGWKPTSILELGCGTGNLTCLLSQWWPDSTITAVDFSPEMLRMTSEKLNHSPKLTCIEAAFQELDLGAGQFDLVISSIAMHHIQDPDKARLIRAIGGWLRPEGFFVLGDQVRGVTDRLYQADVAFYESYALQSGATEDDILNWREHRETQDYYAKVEHLLQWMRESGLVNVDVLWRYCFWAVFQGQKPA